MTSLAFLVIILGILGSSTWAVSIHNHRRIPRSSMLEGLGYYRNSNPSPDMSLSGTGLRGNGYGRGGINGYLNIHGSGEYADVLRNRQELTRNPFGDDPPFNSIGNDATAGLGPSHLLDVIQDYCRARPYSCQFAHNVNDFDNQQIA